MLSDCRVAPMLPVSDVQQVRGFYEDTLGFKPVLERDDAIFYECANGGFSIFVSSGSSDASFTQMSFEVADIEAEMAELRARGVVFEEYDFPGLKTENGIAELEGDKVAWFKDPANNLLALGTMPKA